MNGPMHTSTALLSSLLLLSACEPRTTPDAAPTSPTSANVTPTAAPTTAPTVAAPSAPTATEAATPEAPPTSAAMPETGPRVTTFDLHVDRAPLLKLGCKAQGDALVCGAPAAKITCGEYSQPNDLLGGLSPKATITGCDVNGRDPETKGVYRTGCRINTWHRYVVAGDKKLELIDSREELVKRFAPVETPAEALAFAVAMTDGQALFKIDLPKDAEVFLKPLDPTFVAPVAEGFKVRLYGYQLCGCGPHNHLAVDYLVTRAGEVRELASVPAWSDPKSKGRCVD